jgi:predicted transcriptional regulator
MESTMMINIPINEFKNFVIEAIRNEIQAIKSNIIREKEDKLLSRNEIAKYLGVTTASITTYKNDGMPFLLIKRRPYYKLSQVEAYMQKKKDYKNRL